MTVVFLLSIEVFCSEMGVFIVLFVGVLLRMHSSFDLRTSALAAACCRIMVECIAVHLWLIACRRH